MVPRVPSALTPNRLTAIGFAGAVLALLGYLLAHRHAAFLWVANIGIVVHWLGDSLDGHVARFRKVERARYGFFLDQSIDVIAQALFALGLGLSGYILPSIVACGFAAYLMMNMLSLLRTQISGVFNLATGGMGLTEIRCLFLLANGLFYLVRPQALDLFGFALSYADIGGIIWIVANLVLYVVTTVAELRRLSLQDAQLE
jgi:phosphatidylglycerophosphate synthase